MRTPQSYVKNHPQSITFFVTPGSGLACPSGTQEWPQRGQEGSSWGRTPILPPALLGCHPPGLPHLWFTTILSISNTWRLKKKLMQFGLNASFFKNLIFQIQIIEAPLKMKIQLPHNQLLYVKKKALLHGSKPFLNTCDRFSPASN